MKVVSVEKLSSVVAFRPKQIEVPESVYNSVPKGKIEDFESVLNLARDTYQSKVDEIKAKGEKPQAAKIKSEVIDEIINPFLRNLGINRDVEKKVVRSSKPRITDAKEKVVYESLTEDQIQVAKDYYDNNFKEDMLDDSFEEKPDVIPDDFIVCEEDFTFEGLV